MASFCSFVLTLIERLVISTEIILDFSNAFIFSHSVNVLLICKHLSLGSDSLFLTGDRASKIEKDLAKVQVSILRRALEVNPLKRAIL